MEQEVGQRLPNDVMIIHWKYFLALHLHSLRYRRVDEVGYKPLSATIAYFGSLREDDDMLATCPREGTTVLYPAFSATRELGTLCKVHLLYPSNLYFGTVIPEELDAVVQGAPKASRSPCPDTEKDATSSS
jgi:hypothetical protein